MSLRELLDINKIVFGVDNPKISVVNKYQVNFVANESSYKNGFVVDFNFKNKFVYCGNGTFMAQIITKREYNHVVTYRNDGNFIFNNYFNFEDLRDFLQKHQISLILGISVVKIYPYSLISQTYGVTLEGGDIKISGNLYTPVPISDGICRYYFIEYDNSRILDF